MANKNNPSIGKKFELKVLRYFKSQGKTLDRPFVFKIGKSKSKGEHKFDLGSKEEKIVVECKCHSWTKSRYVPSAKMSVWNEAMYYFTLMPKSYRKLFFFKKSFRNGESLGQYYIKRYSHLIPQDVELWEYCLDTNKVTCLKK